MNINLDEVEMGNMEDLNALYAIFQCFFYLFFYESSTNGSMGFVDVA